MEYFREDLEWPSCMLITSFVVKLQLLSEYRGWKPDSTLSLFPSMQKPHQRIHSGLQAHSGILSQQRPNSKDLVKFHLWRVPDSEESR
ncbi:unnamed protein product [Calypogeia fissa]